MYIACIDMYTLLHIKYGRWHIRQRVDESGAVFTLKYTYSMYQYICINVYIKCSISIFILRHTQYALSYILYILYWYVYWHISNINVDIYGSLWTKASLPSHSNTYIACIDIYALTYILYTLYWYLYWDKLNMYYTTYYAQCIDMYIDT